MTLPYDVGSDDELDDVLGAPEHSTTRRPSQSSAPAIPAPNALEELYRHGDEIALEQYQRAVYRLHEDTREFARFPWAALDEAAGALVPQDLWIVGGRTGTGKSLFCTNMLDALVADGRRVLYVGLEQEPPILRVKWACVRTGTSPRLVLAPTREEFGTPHQVAARSAVEADMRDYQRSDAVRERVHFAATRFIDRARLRRLTQWGVEEKGVDVVIVDHIDRAHHGEGKNPFHEVSQTIRLAKELAVEESVVMVLASQVGRPTGDLLHMYLPPQLHELRGAGTKEEESDVVLGVGRSLKPGLTKKDFEAVRQKRQDRASLYEPEAMTVEVLKHRLDGEVLREARLRVTRGRITDRYPRTDDA